MIELPIVEAQAAPAAQPGEKPRQRFWRSLVHLHKDPGFEETAQHEFMPGATEPPDGFSRRQFVQLMGASMALAGLTACRRPVQNILPYTRKPEEVIPGIPLFYATAMPFRGAVEPLLLESHEGRPTKAEGNPEHPTARGASSMYAQAATLTLYDPDRSRTVRREGDTSSWDDFVGFCQGFTAGAATKRVVVLAEETTSPTMMALRQQLAQTYPQLQWITYWGPGDDPVALGMQQAFGQPYRPLYQFDEADIIVSLDADFLGPTARNFVYATRTFADGRRLASPEDTMSRLYAVESTYSVTGGMADHRLRLRAADIPAFAAAVAARLGVGTDNTGTSFADHPFVAAIADDLRQAGSRGIILAGETQPPEVHALCVAINSALGSVGTTVRLLDTGAAPVQPQAETLAQLVEDLNAGSVDLLLCLGTNPVYHAPAGMDFAAAMQRAGESIHVGLWRDETAQNARWHVPATHYLEAWGDGRAYDGTLSVVQPLIAPLYDDAHSEIEVLAALAAGRDQAGYDLVRNQWRGVIPEPFEQGWKKVLHDGFLPDTGYPTATVDAVQAPDLSGLSTPAADELELVFRLDPRLLDGTYANNGWCQELPDPTTKVVWDNVALMSPQTAEDLGLSVEYSEGTYYVDMVTLTVGGQSVDLPVWVLPGHADGSISVNVGYGRTIASERPHRESPFWDKDEDTDIYGHGPLANGVGANVAPLRPTASTRVVAGVQVSATGETYMIVTTQEHGALDVEARPFVRMATYDEYKATPDFVQEQEEPTPGEPFEQYPTLWKNRHPRDTPAMKDSPYYRNQWGMTIDLNACTGCNACVVACNSENNIQVVGKEHVADGREMHWLRIDRYFMSPDGEEVPSDPQMVMQLMPCQHCENAPCESVCPVAATVHSPDGTNQMIYNRCIGTRYCSNNCPYKVRRYNFFNWTKTLPLSLQMAQNPNVTVRFRGVMEKCSFCIQRIRRTQQRAQQEERTLREGEVQTACQQACPAEAIAFGDLNDPDSVVSQQRERPRAYEVLGELNVKPRVSYLGRVRNPNPRLESASEA